MTFTCCEDLSVSVVNRYLSGLIQSGSWGLFTDAMKMNIGNLCICIEYLINPVFRLNSNLCLTVQTLLFSPPLC